MKKRMIVGSLISILIAEAIGFLSGMLAGDIKSVYQSLEQPPFAPPSWVFPVAWTILYALMGIAAYFIYSAGYAEEERRKALKLYVVQLFVNFIWTIVFFGMQAFGWGVLIVLLLDVLVFAMILKFKKISPKAGYLLIPYFLWLLFATYLSIGVYLLN